MSNNSVKLARKIAKFIVNVSFSVIFVAFLISLWNMKGGDTADGIAAGAGFFFIVFFICPIWYAINEQSGS